MKENNSIYTSKFQFLPPHKLYNAICNEASNKSNQTVAATSILALLGGI